MKRSLTLSRAQWEQMRDYVETQAPLEACGLLGGRNGHVEVVIPIRNAENSPVRFRMEPLEQLRAFEQIESAGMELLAIFHSHPHGPAVPSPTDIAEAYYQVIQVIWCPGEGEWLAHAFWIEAGHAAEVPLWITGV
ncbi:MAG: M67 family metallopeptidase [Anaerolineales bacterium]|nr:M67 family metallopeptidase [Anaerolineales bacterium]MCX7756252.1 M67 family metallopeptidase [Anaerolineales bacterium]MDW8277389.1 M67 family metallopeptidase [Anaerolineales bacterium]